MDEDAVHLGGEVDLAQGRAMRVRRAWLVWLALGVAVLSTLAASRTGSLAEALTGGCHLAFATGTGLLGAIALTGLLLRRPRGPRSA
ncbi:hypothetical protein [Streptomyces sp. NPDC000656]|uniref:hypothetical protein n=1 Tax=unclassified Streptomyces TaxID=2593676 RepID=UPI0036B1BEA0